LLHDQELLAIELDLGAAPLAEQHAVADLDVERDDLAGLVAGARPDGDDLALLGLLLGRVGNDDAARGLLFRVDPLDHDTVMQGTELHEASSIEINMVKPCPAALRAAARNRSRP